LKCAGTNIIARIGSYHYGGNLFAQSPQIVVQIKATHPGHFEVDNQAAGAAQFGERKNFSPDENAWATNPIERIKTLIAFPTASSSSTIATIGPLFGTWRDR
jgi:hypothetical protein